MHDIAVHELWYKIGVPAGFWGSRAPRTKKKFQKRWHRIPVLLIYNIITIVWRTSAESSIQCAGALRAARAVRRTHRLKRRWRLLHQESTTIKILKWAACNVFVTWQTSRVTWPYDTCILLRTSIVRTRPRSVLLLNQIRIIYSIAIAVLVLWPRFRLKLLFNYYPLNVFD